MTRTTEGSFPSDSLPGTEWPVGYGGHGLAPGLNYGYFGPSATWAAYMPVTGVGPNTVLGNSNWYGPNLTAYNAVAPAGGFPPGWQTPPLDPYALRQRYSYGCPGPGATVGRPPGPYAGRGPRSTDRSVGRLHAEVAARLAADPNVDARDVAVQVERGVVTLTGQVSHNRQKRRAAVDALSVPGIVQVDNRLVVEERGDPGSQVAM
jgi:hypothetical protein